jgi:DNA-binding CsgD family transcriptional regulator/tetratricopeptide (TPR) repeat protein
VAFVGREPELSRLLGALGGDTRLVMVTGDAGVGKTRLVGEGMARAAAAGMVVVRGECLPLAGALPLLPVASALGELARLNGGSVLAAALGGAPGFVRREVGRLLPALGLEDGPGAAGRGEGWQRERLFTAVAELLAAVAGCSGTAVGLVVEDVHWADSATLDFLTYLSRPSGGGAVSVLVTCRGDEAPVAAHVADWLAQVRGTAEMEEIALGPLSRAEVAEQVTALAGGPVPPRVVDELCARTGGNPFFTEQLVAAALADGAAEGGWDVPAGLPARLAGLLAARAARCAGDARTVLDALAVAGRPVDEDLLGAVTGLDAGAMRQALMELAAARLLAEDTAGGAHRPRHALLAEAVTSRLLAGERVILHQRTAQALAAAGGEALAAEVAGHWQAAGNPAGELAARVAAAETAERVFGYTEAAAHWQRAIELWPEVPGAAVVAAVDLPRLYVRAIDALSASGDAERRSEVTEEAHRRFADHPDPATAAVICHRAALFRRLDEPAAGLQLIEKALRLFGQAPPSAEHVDAWFGYGRILLSRWGQREAGVAAFRHALEIAEAAGATDLLPRIHSRLVYEAFWHGQIEQGFAVLHREQATAQASGNDTAVLLLAATESDALLTTGQFEDAVKAALRGLQTARQTGREASYDAAVLAANAAEALLARGRTAEAAALIDPLTTGLPGRDRHLVHDLRAEIDLLRGDIEAAAGRLQRSTALAINIDDARATAQRRAEVALWATRPGSALEEVRKCLAVFKTADLTIFSGWLLVVGMRACADLAGQARARCDDQAAHHAESAAADLAAWVGTMGRAPFTDHPFVATIPAERATWDAERARVAGGTDPAAWAAAAKTWDGLGCPHRAAYAWWRQAQAQLDAGQPPTAAAAALQAAAAAADGHQPLLAQVRTLASRARIPLHTPAATAQAPPHHETRTPYGLTGRELAVLRLVAAGRSNAQIGAELYISRATAAVHVTSILRKLGVTNRVQAATLAERAGLLDTQP